MARPSVSVKLSAIHPRFDPGKEARLDARAAAAPGRAGRRRAPRIGLGLTIDAEEQDRLDLTLGLFAAAFRDPALDGLAGSGSRRAGLRQARAAGAATGCERLAEQAGKRIPVRLVKGAYWDSEIKWAQERGLADYPVFTRKAAHGRVLPRLHAAACSPTRRRSFRSSPPTTRSRSPSVCVAAPAADAYEFQRLHGMGEALYEEVVGAGKLGVRLPHLCAGRAARGPASPTWCGACSRTAPTPRSSTAWPTRRRRIEEIIRDPVAARGGGQERGRVRACCRGRPTSMRPSAVNSARAWRSDQPGGARSPLAAGDGSRARGAFFAVAPMVDGKPLDRQRRGGAGARARTTAASAWARCARPIRRRSKRRWRRAQVCRARPGTGSAGRRAREILEKAADLYEREPRAPDGGDGARGRQDAWTNALGDVREAVDFLRYYALRGAAAVRRPRLAQGPDRRDQHARAARARCRSPASRPGTFRWRSSPARWRRRWPPATRCSPSRPSRRRSSPFLAVQLLHEAGVPARRAASAARRPARSARRSSGPARGRRRLHRLQRDRAGRSTRALADAARRRSCRFIAETGGLNAMIADSSALPEQVIRDVVRSAFDSAGQRCSAARAVLRAGGCAAKPMIDMLVGRRGGARDRRPARLRDRRRPRHRRRTPRRSSRLTSCACASRRPSWSDLPLPDRVRGRHLRHAGGVTRSDARTCWRKRCSGPSCMWCAIEGGHLDRVVDAINASGYGLTLRPAQPHRQRRRLRGRARRASATSTSTATRSAPWSACSRSAARACPAPAPRPAGRATSPASPPSACAPPTSRRQAATSGCWDSKKA